LSGASTPVRIGNVDVHEALSRVGSVGFLPPDCSVGLFPVDEPYRLLVCSFEKAWFEDITGVTRAVWDTHTGPLVSIRNKRLEILMQEIHAEWEQQGFGHAQMIESLSTQALVELARHSRQLPCSESGSSDSLALAPWQLNRIQQRIESGPEEGYPMLGELAELCAISQSHLMRCFKASTGWQIHRYIAAQRISRARSLLAQPGSSCRDVSLSLGYSSPAYFATAFKRQTGLTPREYRRRALTAPAEGWA
jgi:AraC family transcriptional regulator